MFIRLMLFRIYLLFLFNILFYKWIVIMLLKLFFRGKLLLIVSLFNIVVGYYRIIGDFVCF